MIRSNALAATVVLATFTSFNAWAADPLPVETHKVLTAALAVEAAEAAIAACKAQGYNVTVTVADRAGLPKVVIVRDGPPGVGRGSPRPKAYTAAGLPISTAGHAKPNATPGRSHPRTLR